MCDVGVLDLGFVCFVGAGAVDLAYNSIRVTVANAASFSASCNFPLDSAILNSNHLTSRAWSLTISWLSFSYSVRDAAFSHSSIATSRDEKSD